MARPSSRPVRYCSLVITAAFVLMLPALTLAAIEDAGHPQTGAELYMKACANCHGADGRGAPPSQLAFAEQVPDFTDCDFAMREPSADWVGIAFEGGPTRGFSEMMPAFGEVLTEAELELVIAYVKDFCQDKRWPSGDLNLPRAIYTEKAFVEDEAVFSVAVPTEGDKVSNKVIYEQRIGPKSQFELIVPLGWAEKPEVETGESDGWTSAVGDIAVGV
jgi:mono/diheme cytochrome c family protein